MSSDWGPPGLETAPPPANHGPLIGIAFTLALSFGVQWCTKNVGYVEHLSWRRSCGDAPSEIRTWVSPYRNRRAEEVVTLQGWAARHPGRVNNQYGPPCDTALHLAARVGRDDLANVLIAAGADIEARNELDVRPLHVAATYGHPAVAKLLLARRADIHARDRGWNTPLHAAAFGVGTQSNSVGRLEVARLLVAAGADVNAHQPGSGFTPLRAATYGEGRNAAMAELLLAHGADPRGAEEPLPPHHAR